MTGRCHNCAHLKGFVTLWCTSVDAVQRRRTHIPSKDVHDCPDWEEGEEQRLSTWFDRFKEEVREMVR